MINQVIEFWRTPCISKSDSLIREWPANILSTFIIKEFSGIREEIGNRYRPDQLWFPKIKRRLKGKHFEDTNDIQENVTSQLNSTT